MSESSNSIYGGAAGGAAAGSTVGPWGAAAGALLGAGAGYFGYRANKDANAANAQQAAEQMKFQERMSSTAHQREVSDLRAAGINPIATATGGSGASSPGGSSATMTPNDSSKGINHVATLSNIKSVVDSNRRANEIQPKMLRGADYDNVNKSLDNDLKGVQAVTALDTQPATIAAANQTYANLLKTGSLLDKELGIKDSSLQKMSEEIQGLSTSNARSRLQLQQEEAAQDYNLKQGEFKSKYRNFLVPTQIGAETIGTAFGGVNSALKSIQMLKP